MAGITNILKQAPRFLLRVILNGCAAFLFYAFFFLVGLALALIRRTDACYGMRRSQYLR